MTDEPLMNDDDIYAEDIEIDEPIRGKPLATYHHKILLVPEDSDIVTVDRALLVQMARLVVDMRMFDMMIDGYTIDDARALHERCEQIIKEHGE
jgi:hypothetical protein